MNVASENLIVRFKQNERPHGNGEYSVRERFEPVL